MRLRRILSRSRRYARICLGTSPARLVSSRSCGYYNTLSFLMGVICIRSVSGSYNHIRVNVIYDVYMRLICHQCPPRGGWRRGWLGTPAIGITLFIELSFSKYCLLVLEPQLSNYWNVYWLLIALRLTKSGIEYVILAGSSLFPWSEAESRF